MSELVDVVTGGVSAVVLNIFADILGKLLEPFNEVCNRILEQYKTSVSVREQELYGIPHSRLVGTCLFPLQEQDEIKERIGTRGSELESDEQKWNNTIVDIKLFTGISLILILLGTGLWVGFDDLRKCPYIIKLLDHKILFLLIVISCIIAVGLWLFLLRARDYEKRYRELCGSVEDMITWPGHIPYVSEVPLREPMVVRIVRLSIRGFCKVVRWIKK